MFDFRDQIIYFIAIDRFFKGERNLDLSEFKELDESKTDWTKYWGGNLKGIIEKLDYLKDMGITAICLSPIFELNPGLEDFEKRGSNKFFGYFPKDFKSLNKTFIHNEKDIFPLSNNSTVLDELIQESKKRNIKIIIDMVCNYSNSDNSANKTQIYNNGEFLTSIEDDKKNWYHKTNPGEESWQDKWQNENRKYGYGFGQLNEHNTEFRNYIKDVMKSYLKKGIDAFFINTVKNMPIWFWQEIICEMTEQKDDFFIFGEWHGGGVFNDASMVFTNYSSMPILDYSLQKAIENALARDLPAGFYLIDDIFKKDGKLKSATEMITFIENNSTARFLSYKNDPARLELAINLIMTCRGIPLLFYGTEQLLFDNTNNGFDPYNRPMMEKWSKDSRIFSNIKKLSRLRSENIALQRGYQQTRYITDNIFVFVRKYGENYCAVGMNKGPTKTFDIAGIEFPDGEYFDVLSDKKIVVEKNRIVHLCLDENETIVISKHSKPAQGQVMVTFQLSGYDTHYGEIVKVIGSCPELGNWDVEKAPLLQYINSNTWRGDIVFNESAGKSIFYKYAAVDFDGSIKYENRTARNRIVPVKKRSVWRNEWI